MLYYWSRHIKKRTHGHRGAYVRSSSISPRYNRSNTSVKQAYIQPARKQRVSSGEQPAPIELHNAPSRLASHVEDREPEASDRDGQSHSHPGKLVSWGRWLLVSGCCWTTLAECDSPPGTALHVVELVFLLAHLETQGLLHCLSTRFDVSWQRLVCFANEKKMIIITKTSTASSPSHANIVEPLPTSVHRPSANRPNGVITSTPGT